MATGTRRRFVLGAAMAASVASVGSRARAAGAGLTATIAASQERARVGDEIVLELAVTRTGSGAVTPPTMPEGLADAFEVVSQHPRKWREFGLGGSSRTLMKVTLGVVALKAGKHELVFTAGEGDDRVTSNKLAIVVEDEAAATSPAEVAPSTAKPTEATGDVFLWVTTDKSTAWVGEQVTFELNVYERSMATVALRSPPNFADFYTYDLPEGDGSLEEVAGVLYRVRPGMRRALFPQKAGRLIVGPAEIAIGRRRRDRGPAIALDVKPLPAEGQPKGFSANNVGKFEIKSSVDRNAVDAGQPFTWTVQLSGRGNVAQIDPGPLPKLAGARTYEPKVETKMEVSVGVGGTRTYAMLVIPERTGTLELPALEFPYFDPEAGAYVVARSEPIRIEVTGESKPVEEAAPSPEALSDDREQLAPIVVGDTVPRDPPPRQLLTPGRWLAGMIGVGSTAVIAALGTLAWRRFGPDDAARRTARDRARVREQLDQARAAVDGGEAFHVVVAGLLHECAVARAGADGVGLARPELMRLLLRRGVAAEDVRKLDSLLERCDAARFAAQRGSAEDRRTMLDAAIALIGRSSLRKGAAT